MKKGKEEVEIFVLQHRRSQDFGAEGVEGVWGGCVPLPGQLGGLEEHRKFVSSPAGSGVWRSIVNS